MKDGNSNQYFKRMKMNRILYLGYYFKKLDREKFNLFMEYTQKYTGKSRAAILADILGSVFRYNISILEYFQFRFFDLNHEERNSWAGTGFMYEYQLLKNPKHERHILDDKTLFYKHYGEFFVHTVADIEDLKQPDLRKKLLENPSGKLVFKVSDGKCGAQVEIKKCSDLEEDEIIQFMIDGEYDLVEEFVRQHEAINRISPTAVNTIRIFTDLNEDGGVDILGCRFRISVNSPVDNMAAGNLAAPVDTDTGIVSGEAVYGDITKKDCAVHPVTHQQITGFQIPFWKDTLEMVKRAALKHPQNRSIGWDVVITDRGPGLIEGNHDWCKLLWQMPVKRGLRNQLFQRKIEEAKVNHKTVEIGV